MGFIKAFRRVVSGAVVAALGNAPLELRCVSEDGANSTVYIAHRNGLKITVARDYPSAPWSWCVEGRDGRLVAFRGNAGATYEAAELAVCDWLASSDGQAAQGAIDEGPTAA